LIYNALFVIEFFVDLRLCLFFSKASIAPGLASCKYDGFETDWEQSDGYNTTQVLLKYMA